MNRISQCAPDKLAKGALPRPPSLGRVYLVAADLDDWTAEERAWIAENPKWLEYRKRFADAIAAARKDKLDHYTATKSHADGSFRV